MKAHLKLIATLSLTAGALSSTAVLAAGTMGGGGGKGVVCRNSSGGIQSVELLDLWEARAIYGRKWSDSGDSVAAQVEHLLDALKNSIDSHDMKYTSNSSDGGSITLQGPDALKMILRQDAVRFTNVPGTEEHVHWLVGAKLTPTDDSYEAAIPDLCEIAQLVRYQDGVGNGDVLIDLDLFTKMDSTNQAALIAHEVYYALLRQYGEKSSIRVRRTIGLAVAGYNFSNPGAEIPVTHLSCFGSNRSILEIFEAPDYKGYVAFMRVLSGRVSIDETNETKTIAASLDDLFRPDSSQGAAECRSLGDSVSFDYSYCFQLLKDPQGNKYAIVNLTGAPDERVLPGPEKLQCF